MTAIETGDTGPECLPHRPDPKHKPGSCLGLPIAPLTPLLGRTIVCGSEHRNVKQAWIIVLTLAPIRPPGLLGG
jgi:hypothetical protein